MHRGFDASGLDSRKCLHCSLQKPGKLLPVRLVHPEVEIWSQLRQRRMNTLPDSLRWVMTFSISLSLSLCTIPFLLVQTLLTPFFFLQLSPVMLMLTKRPYHITLTYPPLPYPYASTLCHFFTLTPMKKVYPRYSIPCLSRFSFIPCQQGRGCSRSRQ